MTKTNILATPFMVNPTVIPGLNDPFSWLSKVTLTGRSTGTVWETVTLTPKSGVDRLEITVLETYNGNQASRNGFGEVEVIAQNDTSKHWTGGKSLVNFNQMKGKTNFILAVFYRGI